MTGKLIWVYLCGENGDQLLLGCDVVYLVVPNNTLFHVEGERWSLFVVLPSYETTRRRSQQTDVATKKTIIVFWCISPCRWELLAKLHGITPQQDLHVETNFWANPFK